MSEYIDAVGPSCITGKGVRSCVAIGDGGDSSEEVGNDSLLAFGDDEPHGDGPVRCSESW